MEVDEVEPHPQPSRAQHDHQVSQASSAVAANGASPPADAVHHWQPTVTLVPLTDLGLPAIKGHARLMFASGAGEALASGRGISTDLSVKGLVLVCGTAILELCTEQRSKLLRPGGQLDKVEMLGWLLGDLLGGRLVSHKEAMAIGTKAGKMVFGKTATLTSKQARSLGSLTKLDNKASARLSKLAADDPQRAHIAAEDAATRAAHLLEPVTLPVPQAPKKIKRREPLLSELPAAPASTAAPAETPAETPTDNPTDAPADTAGAKSHADAYADAIASLERSMAQIGAEDSVAQIDAEIAVVRANKAQAKAETAEAVVARDAAVQELTDGQARLADAQAHAAALEARVAEMTAAMQRREEEWAARQADIQRRADASLLTAPINSD